MFPTKLGGPSYNQAVSIYMNEIDNIPDSKILGAYMGPIWGRQDPGGPHAGPMNLVIWDVACFLPPWLAVNVETFTHRSVCTFIHIDPMKLAIWDVAYFLPPWLAVNVETLTHRSVCTFIHIDPMNLVIWDVACFLPPLLGVNVKTLTHRSVCTFTLCISQSRC